MLYLFGPKETDFVNGDSDLIHNTYDEVVDRSKGFYLKFKVALDKDKRYKKIKKEMIINAYTPDGWNQFRVFDIYNHSHYVEVVATQLHYDLNYKKVFPFNLNRATAQIALNVFVENFKSDLPNFKFTSNIIDTHNFSTDDDLERLDEGHNALEILNRIATRWGGELQVDGYNVHLTHKLGTFTNALLYEHKNISEFVDETSMSEIVTRIHAVSRFRPEREEGSTEEPEEVVIKVVVDSPLIDEYAQVYEEDYTNNDARTRDQLISWANLKYSTNNVDKPARSIKVETNIIDGQEINYGDDLVLKYTKHDVDEIIRCVGYQYNPNSKQYISVTLGSNMNSLSSTITGAVHDSTKNQLSGIEKQVQIIKYASNNQNRVTTGPLAIPDPIEGDMWYYHPEGRPNEVELRIFQDGGWVTIISDMTGENVRRAIADLELEAEGLADGLEANELVAEDAVAKAEESLEKLGTIDTTISDLRTDLSTVGGKAESSLEIIGIDGGVMYSKNRRLGSKSQPIQPDDRGLIQHNGEGFELGETYTISMKVSCIFDDVITWEERSRTESVPFVRETQYRTDLLPEESFVQRNGINGTATYTWQIELVNGEPTGNKTEEVRTNYQAPVNEIFIQGTKQNSNLTLNFTADDLLPPPVPRTKSEVVLNLIEPGGSVPIDPVKPGESQFNNARVVNFTNDYGGVGDANTDNFNAFLEVVRDSINEPLVLEIDSGTYDLMGADNQRLEPWPNKSKGLRIVGKGDVVIRHKNNRTNQKNEYYFMQLAMTEDSLGFEVENITLDGIRNPQEELFYTQSESNPIYNIPMARGFAVNGAHNVLFNNVTFKHMYGGYGILMEEYRNVSITNTVFDKVGGNDIQESFGVPIYLGGHTGDAFVNIDNVHAQGMTTHKELRLSWIGVVLENGTIQSSDPTFWMRDKNTTVNITNSSFIDYQSTFHVESVAGNVYWNVDNVETRASNYQIVAGVYGEYKESSNNVRMDMMPYGRAWGIVKGLYYSEAQEAEENWNGHNMMNMHNSVINLIKVDGFEDPIQAVAYGSNVTGRLHNSQINDLPNKLVANGSALLYNSEVNIAQGSNETRQSLQNGHFSDVSKQRVEFNNTNVNPYGSHKNVTFGPKPAFVKNEGFVAPFIDLPIQPPI